MCLCGCPIKGFDRLYPKNRQGRVMVSYWGMSITVLKCIILIVLHKDLKWT